MTKIEGTYPLLSLIIPMFNVQEYLSECLQSVAEQDHDELEVVLINDCSTDHSRAIAAEFKHRIKGMVIIDHETNQGLGPSRNTGIISSSGKFLMFLDSDDWLTPNAISDVLATIKEQNFDLAHFGCNRVSASEVEQNLFFSYSDSQTTEVARLALLELPSYVWLNVYRREFIEKLGLTFRNLFYEDIPWTITTVLSAGSIITKHSAICNYRIRPQSITHSPSHRHLDLFIGYTEVFKLERNMGLGHHLKKALDNAFHRSVYYLLKNRKGRLREMDYKALTESYLELSRKYNIKPRNLKTFVMFSVTLFILVFPMRQSPLRISKLIFLGKPVSPS